METEKERHFREIITSLTSAIGDLKNEVNNLKAELETLKRPRQRRIYWNDILTNYALSQKK